MGTDGCKLMDFPPLYDPPSPCLGPLDDFVNGLYRLFEISSQKVKLKEA